MITQLTTNSFLKQGKKVKVPTFLVPATQKVMICYNFFTETVILLFGLTEMKYYIF
jgi:hypothetical protein